MTPPFLASQKANPLPGSDALDFRNKTSIGIWRSCAHAGQEGLRVGRRGKIFFQFVQLLPDRRAIGGGRGSAESNIRHTAALRLLILILMFVDVLSYFILANFYRAVGNTEVRYDDIRDRCDQAVVGISLFQHPLGDVRTVG